MKYKKYLQNRLKAAEAKVEQIRNLQDKIDNLDYEMFLVYASVIAEKENISIDAALEMLASNKEKFLEVSFSVESFDSKPEKAPTEKEFEVIRRINIKFLEQIEAGTMLNDFKKAVAEDKELHIKYTKARVGEALGDLPKNAQKSVIKSVQKELEAANSLSKFIESSVSHKGYHGAKPEYAGATTFIYIAKTIVESEDEEFDVVVQRLLKNREELNSWTDALSSPDSKIKVDPDTIKKSIVAMNNLIDNNKMTLTLKELYSKNKDFAYLYDDAVFTSKIKKFKDIQISFQLSEDGAKRIDNNITCVWMLNFAKSTCESQNVPTGPNAERSILIEVVRMICESDCALRNEFFKHIDGFKTDMSVSGLPEEMYGSIEEFIQKAKSLVISNKFFHILQSTLKRSWTEYDYDEAKYAEAFEKLCDELRGQDLSEHTNPSIPMMVLGRMDLNEERPDVIRLVELCSFAEKNAIRLKNIDYKTYSETLSYLKQILDDTHGNHIIHFGRNWAKSGFPVIEMGHKVASSLMFTYGPENIEAPWSAFMIKVPNGLVLGDGGQDLRNILVWQLPDKKGWFLVCRYHNMEKVSVQYLLVQGLDEETIKKTHITSSDIFKDDKSCHRAFELIANLVAGSCMLISAKQDMKTMPYKPRSESRSTRPRGQEPPEGTRFIISKNVDIDLREQLHEFVHNKSQTEGKKISVQFIVRGHRRWQACGHKWTDHKLIWVNPYWKGPMAGDALLRGYDLAMPQESDKK